MSVAVSFGMIATVIAPVAEARDLDYRPAAGCPSADDVGRAIEERAPEGRPARITIEKTAATPGSTSSYRGELVLGDGDAKMTRTVAGRSCAAVVDALALAMAIDGDAGENANAKADANANADADAKAEADPRGGRTVTVVSPADRDAVLAPRPARVTWSAGATGSWMNFIGGETGAVSLFADLRWDKRLFGLHFFQPSIRLSVARTLENTVADDFGGPSSHFQLTSTALELCPFGNTMWHERLTTAICARGELGVLDASAGNGESRSRPWGSVGETARLRISVFGAAAWRPVVELSASVVAPLSRDTFHLPNETGGVRVPGVVESFGIGMGVAFP